MLTCIIDMNAPQVVECSSSERYGQERRTCMTLREFSPMFAHVRATCLRNKTCFSFFDVACGTPGAANPAAATFNWGLAIGADLAQR